MFPRFQKKTGKTLWYYVFGVLHRSPPRMFLPLHLLSELRIQHGAIWSLYVTFSYLIWIFCRGVSGFATDCPCGVWCRGLTTCVLHAGPPFGNRLLNNSWPLGFMFPSQILFLIFSSTPVLTFSIDVVFILSMASMNVICTPHLESKHFHSFMYQHFCKT